ncbi:MAG: PDZ domain-containing protein [Cyclobacteriaceae bacterium]
MRLKLFLFLQLIIYGCFSQPRMGYWLHSNVIRIPFDVVNNSLFAKVNLNEHKDLSFIVDTGSNYSVVFTDSLLSLPVQHKVISIKGFGNTDSLTAHIAIDNLVEIGGFVTRGKQLLVISKSKIGLQQFYDRPIHGVIGLDLLRQFDTEINFSSNRLILRKNGAKIKNGSRWRKVPFHLTENAIIIPTTLTTSKKTEAIYLILDTGSELPLLLQEKFCPDKSMPTIIGMGILGYASGRIGLIPRINIGELEMNSIATAFPDSASSRWNRNLPQQGNLGIQFLKKHRTIINYSQGFLQVKPLRRLAHTPFQFNRSGIAIEVGQKKECDFFISEVAPGSPAEMAGLLKGDKIIFVDRIPCTHLTLQKITERIFTSKKTDLEITVMRESNIKHVQLNLQ